MRSGRCIFIQILCIPILCLWVTQESFSSSPVKQPPDFSGLRTYIGSQCLAVLKGNTVYLHPYYLGMGRHLPEKAVGLQYNLVNLKSPDASELKEVLREIQSNPSAPMLRKPDEFRAGWHWAAQNPELDGQIAARRVFEIGKGGYSRVFVVYGKHPDDPFPMAHQTQQEYFRWIRQNGFRVLKVLNFEKSIENFTLQEEWNVDWFTQLLEKTFNQNLGHALEGVLDAWWSAELLSQVAPRVLYQGAPLFEVAQTRWSNVTGKTAVFEQDYFIGPTAWQLQETLDQPTYSEQYPWIDAAEFLKEWGLTREELLELKPQLVALEEVFLHLNRWAKTQEPAKRLQGRQNYLSVSGLKSPVRFDFNHGRNIIYDVRRKKFVMVDA